MKDIMTHLRGICGLPASIGDAAGKPMCHGSPGSVVGVVASRFDGLRGQNRCAACLAHIGDIPYFWLVSCDASQYEPRDLDEATILDASSRASTSMCTSPTHTSLFLKYGVNLFCCAWAGVAKPNTKPNVIKHAADPPTAFFVCFVCGIRTISAPSLVFRLWAILYIGVRESMMKYAHHDHQYYDGHGISQPNVPVLRWCRFLGLFGGKGVRWW